MSVGMSAAPAAAGNASRVRASPPLIQQCSDEGIQAVMPGAQAAVHVADRRKGASMAAHSFSIGMSEQVNGSSIRTSFEGLVYAEVSRVGLGPGCCSCERTAAAAAAGVPRPAPWLGGPVAAAVPYACGSRQSVSLRGG